jgi:hypothetical protein
LRLFPNLNHIGYGVAFAIEKENSLQEIEADIKKLKVEKP